jgi:hypothetical protein
MSINKIVTQYVVNLSYKIIFTVIFFCGILISITPLSSIHGSISTFFQLFFIKAILCWIAAFMFFSLSLKVRNLQNIIYWKKIVQIILLMLLVILFFFSPFLYLYFILTDT